MGGAINSTQKTVTKAREAAYQQCIHPRCAATLAIDEVRFSCPACGDLLDVVYDWDRLAVPARLADFERKWASRLDPLCFSGVWRFRELLPFAPREKVITIGEGQTLLQHADRVGQYAGMKDGRLFFSTRG